MKLLKGLMILFSAVVFVSVIWLTNDSSGFVPLKTKMQDFITPPTPTPKVDRTDVTPVVSPEVVDGTANKVSDNSGVNLNLENENSSVKIDIDNNLGSSNVEYDGTNMTIDLLGLVYPGSRMVLDSGNEVEYETSVDAVVVGDWYKAVMSKMDYDLKNFVSTVVNGETVIVVNVSDGQTSLKIKITGSSESGTTRIVFFKE